MSEDHEFEEMENKRRLLDADDMVQGFYKRCPFEWLKEHLPDLLSELVDCEHRIIDLARRSETDEELIEAFKEWREIALKIELQAKEIR